MRGKDAERVEIAAASFRFAVNRSLGWNRLRSDLYTVRMAGARAFFEGKGYGHGVGLSQAGARAMASEGRDERAILGFYFPGAHVRVEASDDGWVRHEGDGWSLISADPEDHSGPSDPMVRTGDAAWKKAVGLMPPSGRLESAHPVVRVFGSTEVYRGVTGEPGWTLAATRGERIFLQPTQVVRRSGASVDDLLLHEMLHVLVERESGAATPLWLREGFVETLADPRGAEGAAVPIEKIEGSLQGPHSLRESQVAHRQAAIVVRRLIASYGLLAVHGWLVSGVPADILARG